MSPRQIPVWFVYWLVGLGPGWGGYLGVLCLLEDPLWISVEGHLGAPGIRSGNRSYLKSRQLFLCLFISALTFVENKCTKYRNFTLAEHTKCARSVPTVPHTVPYYSGFSVASFKYNFIPVFLSSMRLRKYKIKSWVFKLEGRVPVPFLFSCFTRYQPFLWGEHTCLIYVLSITINYELRISWVWPFNVMYLNFQVLATCSFDRTAAVWEETGSGECHFNSVAIRNVFPRSRIRIFFIPDPHQRI